jgi:multiple sugar transport system permease protein
MSGNLRTSNGIGFRITAYAVLSVLGLTMLFPYLWMAATALKGRMEAMDTTRLALFPRTPMWGNFSEVFRTVPFVGGVSKTLLLELAIVPVGTLASAAAAFAFAKLPLPFKSGLLLLLMSGTMVPYAALMLPQYRAFQALRMTNTLWPLILPGLFGNVMMMFFFIQYLKGVPTALAEAAEIDGAGYFRIFAGVYLPLIGPALAVQVIFWFTGIWNDFFGPSVYLTRYETMTLQPMLAKLNNDNAAGVNLPVIMAGAALSSVPILVLYAAFQRFFVESVAISGIKA